MHAAVDAAIVVATGTAGSRATPVKPNRLLQVDPQGGSMTIKGSRLRPACDERRALCWTVSD